MSDGGSPRLAAPGTPLERHHRYGTWSPGLSVARLNALTESTPFLLCDLDTIDRRYQELVDLLPDLSVFFAMKSNSATTILRTVKELGGSFEVASANEMHMAQAVGAAPAD